MQKKINDTPIKIVLDAMGGDFGPSETVKGAVQALNNHNVEIVLVGDGQLKEAMRYLFHGMKLAVEPAGAATTAGLLGPLKEKVRGKKVGIIACGSNIDIEDFHNLVS